MKIEVFGFQPVVGKEYVVNFSVNGELLLDTIYNGSELPPLAFPDNSVVNLTITDRETGKLMQVSEYVYYNGKLYKSVFNLDIDNGGSPMNQNVYIKDLHYDLTTGSILVQVKGFVGDTYTLKISDTTTGVLSSELNITLKDDTFYSIPTTLVQNNKFKVTLEDEYQQALDAREFVAPLNSDWRYSGSTPTNSQEVAGEINTDAGLGGFSPDRNPNADSGGDTNLTGEQQDGNLSPNGNLVMQDEEAGSWKDLLTPVNIGAGVLILILIIIVIMKMKNKRRADSYDYDEDVEYDEEDEEDLDEQEDLAGGDEDLEEEERPRSNRNKPRN